jgi:hypothetical protein
MKFLLFLPSGSLLTNEAYVNGNHEYGEKGATGYQHGVAIDAIVIARFGNHGRIIVCPRK